MKRSQVSVIIPIYNTEDYLSSCIESVLNQTYPELEVILIDDGSTDNSLEICRKYQQMDSRVSVYHQSNKGVSDTRNFGLDVSNGEYVTFVDSDDELYLDAIESFMNCIKKNKGDIVAGEKSTTNNEVDNKTEFQLCERIIGAEESIQFAITATHSSACGKMFKKEFIGDIRFESERSINEDGFFMFQCYLKKPILINCNKYVYKYHYREDSASRSAFSEKYLDMLFFLEKKKDIINSKYPSLKNGISIIEIRTHIAFLSVLCRTNEKKYVEYEKKSICSVKENYKKVDKTYLTDYEKKLAKIVHYNLYPVFKLYVRLKYYRNK